MNIPTEFTINGDEYYVESVNIKPKPSLKNIEDRIKKVINTEGFKNYLNDTKVELADLKLSWMKCEGEFDNLPKDYKDAITEGEKELEPGFAGDVIFNYTVTPKELINFIEKCPTPTKTGL